MQTGCTLTAHVQVCGTKKVNRFHPAEVRQGLLNLEVAKEKLQASMWASRQPPRSVCVFLSGQRGEGGGGIQSRSQCLACCCHSVPGSATQGEADPQLRPAPRCWGTTPQATCSQAWTRFLAAAAQHTLTFRAAAQGLAHLDVLTALGTLARSPVSPGGAPLLAACCRL
jgi:hypothetical protein